MCVCVCVSSNLADIIIYPYTTHALISSRGFVNEPKYFATGHLWLCPFHPSLILYYHSFTTYCTDCIYLISPPISHIISFIHYILYRLYISDLSTHPSHYIIHSLHTVQTVSDLSTHPSHYIIHSLHTVQTVCDLSTHPSHYIIHSLHTVQTVSDLSTHPSYILSFIHYILHRPYLISLVSLKENRVILNS